MTDNKAKFGRVSLNYPGDSGIWNVEVWIGSEELKIRVKWKQRRQVDLKNRKQDANRVVKVEIYSKELQVMRLCSIKKC